MGAPVVHFEVIGKDADGLRKFYGELFEWGFSDPMGPTDYTMIDRNTNKDGVGIAGGIGGVPEGYDGHVTVYVEVDDVGQALDKAEQLGAKKMMGPDQVPEGPVIGLFTDPHGNTIGLVGGGQVSGGDGESSGEQSSQSDGGQSSQSDGGQSSQSDGEHSSGGEDQPSGESSSSESGSSESSGDSGSSSSASSSESGSGEGQ